MEQLIQFAISALSLGGTYALLALGLATVFGLLGFLNFAHGDLMTICGYSIYFLLAAGVSFFIAAPIAILVAGLAAVLMERIAFRPLRGRSPMSLLITSFAISLALHVCFQIFISPKSKPIPIPDVFSGYLTFGEVYVSKAQIISIIVSILALILLSAFMTKTRIGIALRASASDFTVARAMGIKANQMIMLAFAISGVLAGIAAVMWIAQRGAVSPAMGQGPMIKALIAVIIGGLSHPRGALYGGFILGTLEAIFLYILPDSWVLYRDAMVLVILISFLMVRPNGIVAPSTEPMR
ncbi:MAG: branched-chain amino acid ABC transporter permease [Cohaesibacteraceae bacterium]|nr:branched-chain amino acid ABC transporter permease [Cohaesibacteraceae bacterium]